MTCGTAWPSKCSSNDTISRRCAPCSGHARLDTTQIYTRIRPPQLKRAVAFYDQAARRMLIG